MVLEDGVQWDRVRAPPVDTLAHDLHASDCLHELRPGDHMRFSGEGTKNSHMVCSQAPNNEKLALGCAVESLNTAIWHMIIFSDSGEDFFFLPVYSVFIHAFLCLAGWWYGVVGHLESCDGNEHFCQCHLSGENIFKRNS